MEHGLHLKTPLKPMFILEELPGKAESDSHAEEAGCHGKEQQQRTSNTSSGS